MTTKFLTAVRAMLLVAAFAFSMPFVAAQASADPQRGTPTAQAHREATPSRDDESTGGVLIILGIVGGLILLAWISSRIGDSRTDTVA